MDETSKQNETPYLSLLINDNLNNYNDKTSVNKVPVSGIEQLEKNINKFENATIKKRLRYMLKNEQKSHTVENTICDKNNQRVSSFPEIYTIITDYLRRNKSHFINLIFNKGTTTTTTSPFSSINNTTTTTNKLYLDLSQHSSHIPAKEIYKKSDTLDYFLFGFSPETELLKGLIAANNIFASLYLSSINMLERDINKRSDILCQNGNELEYAKMLTNIKEIKSVAKSILNFIKKIKNHQNFSKCCSCCGSKKHRESPLVDKFKKNTDFKYCTLKDQSISTNKKNKKNTHSNNIDGDDYYEIMTQKNYKRINSIINKRVNDVMSDIKDNKRKKYVADNNNNNNNNNYAIQANIIKDNVMDKNIQMLSMNKKNIEEVPIIPHHLDKSSSLKKDLTDTNINVKGKEKEENMTVIEGTVATTATTTITTTTPTPTPPITIPYLIPSSSSFNFNESNKNYYIESSQKDSAKFRDNQQIHEIVNYISN
nr:MAG: wsv131-like protein [Metapenaeopsis lamellata majanivirus]